MAEKFILTDGDNTDRMFFMFSQFPENINVNPKHWESKLNYWKNELPRSCRFSNDIFVSCQQCKELFVWKGNSPKGLLTVFRELYYSGDLVPKSSYSDLFGQTWAKWSYSIVSSSLSWTWRKLWSDIDFFEREKFILKELLEEYGLAFLEEHYKSVKYELTDNVVPLNVAKSKYKVNGKCLNDDNLLCVLSYLKNKGHICVGDDEKIGKIIKFKSKTENKVERIQESDFELVRLKKAMAKLTLETKQLEEETERLQETVKQLVKKNDKTQAKKVLSQKRKILKELSTKQDALLAMKENLRTVQGAEGTKLITDALNSSASLLRQSYQGSGLTIDSVENVMEKVIDANEMVIDVDEALSSGLKAVEGDIDMDELEKELNELLVEETDDNLDQILPDVPNTDPEPLATPEVKKQPELLVG